MYILPEFKALFNDVKGLFRGPNGQFPLANGLLMGPKGQIPVAKGLFLGPQGQSGPTQRPPDILTPRRKYNTKVQRLYSISIWIPFHLLKCGKI